MTGGYPKIEEIQNAIKEGINNGLSRGPRLGFPVSQISIKCVKLGLYSPTISNIPAIRMAAHVLTQNLLKSQSIIFLQPIMKVLVNIPSEYSAVVNRDLSGVRRAVIDSIDSENDRTIISCFSPLSKLVGYATSLRGLTKGTGEWTMELEGYEKVDSDQEKELFPLDVYQ